MLRYKIYQNKTGVSSADGKWFARATVNQTIDLEQLAEHMANHNTPYSKGAILGVLTDMVNCIRELVLDGNAVKIPNLAIFWGYKRCSLRIRIQQITKAINHLNFS